RHTRFSRDWSSDVCSSDLITDASHRRARIRRILGDRVRAALASGKVAIVAGFQGVSESKEITTLGRGGSDTTAVALAAALKADRSEERRVGKEWRSQWATC